MKRLPLIAAAAAVAVSLAACSENPLDDERVRDTAAPTVPAPPPATEVPAPTTEPEPAPAPTTVPAPTTEPAPAPAPSTEPPPEPVTPIPSWGPEDLSVRGYLPKEIGVQASIQDLNTGELTVIFTITAIEPNYTCTGPNAGPSANGNYVAVSMDIETTEHLADMAPSVFRIVHRNFEIYNEAGIETVDLVGNSATCLEDSQKLPDVMNPGETASGMIVMDVRYTTGTLAFVPPALGGGGWEWAY